MSDDRNEEPLTTTMSRSEWVQNYVDLWRTWSRGRLDDDTIRQRVEGDWDALVQPLIDSGDVRFKAPVAQLDRV